MVSPCICSKHRGAFNAYAGRYARQTQSSSNNNDESLATNVRIILWNRQAAHGTAMPHARVLITLNPQSYVRYICRRSYHTNTTGPSRCAPVCRRAGPRDIRASARANTTSRRRRSVAATSILSTPTATIPWLL